MDLLSAYYEHYGYPDDGGGAGQGAGPMTATTYHDPHADIQIPSAVASHTPVQDYFTAAQAAGDDQTEEDDSRSLAQKTVMDAPGDDLGVPAKPPALDAAPRAVDYYEGLPEGHLRDEVRVEDWLLDVRAGYDEHLQKLRAEQLQREMLEIRDKPAITEYAKRLTRGGVPVEERLTAVHTKQQEKRKQETQGYHPLDPECTHSPAINKASRHKRARYSIDRDGSQKKSKIEQLRMRLREEEEREVRDGPAINARSRRIAAHRTGGMNVEDYLLLNDKMHKKDMFDRHEQQVADNKLTSQPRITKQAAALKREGDFGERLYGQRTAGSLIGTSGLENFSIEESTRRDKGVLSALGERGEKESFTPTINPRSHSREKSEVPIEDRLYEKYKHAQRELEERRQALEDEQRRSSSTVHTSKQSQVIFTARVMDGVGAHDRLYRQPRTPKFHDDTPRQPKKTVTPAAFNGKLSEWNAKRARNRMETEKMRMEQYRQSMKECTFDPFKSPTIRSLRNSSAGRGYKARLSSTQVTEGSVAERSSTWVKRRDARLNKEQHERGRRELQGCTFVPYTNKDIPKRTALTDKNANAYGYNEFINRLKKARDDRQEEELRKESAFTKGDKWDGQPTVPKEFSLGGHKGDIKSLEKMEPVYRLDDTDTENAYPLAGYTADTLAAHAHVPPAPFAFPPSDARDVDDFISTQHASVMAMFGN